MTTRRQATIKRIATAIHESVALKESRDCRVIVLAYRDALRSLVALRAEQVEFISDPDGIQKVVKGELHRKVSRVIDEASASLCSDRIAHGKPYGLYLHFQRQLIRVSHCLATELVSYLDEQVARNRIGAIKRFGGNVAKCTLPGAISALQHDNPLDVMIDALFSGSKNRSENVVTEFVIARNERIVESWAGRRPPPVQNVFDRTPAPLRGFLHVVNGTVFRRDNEIVDGGFGVVAFEPGYVLDSWTDDEAPLPGRRSTHLAAIHCTGIFVLVLVLLLLGQFLYSLLRPKPTSELPPISNASTSITAATEELPPIPQEYEKPESQIMREMPEPSPMAMSFESDVQSIRPMSTEVLKQEPLPPPLPRSIESLQRNRYRPRRPN